jgi:hypothetical protein
MIRESNAAVDGMMRLLWREREREDNELAPEAEKAVKSGWMEQQGMAVQQFVSSESKLFRNSFVEIHSNLFFLT